MPVSVQKILVFFLSIVHIINEYVSQGGQDIVSAHKMRKYCGCNARLGIDKPT